MALDSTAWITEMVALLKTHFDATVHFTDPRYTEKLALPIVVINPTSDEFHGDGARFTRYCDIHYIVKRDSGTAEAYIKMSEFMTYLARRPAPSDIFVQGYPLTIAGWESPDLPESDADVYHQTLSLTQELKL